jgi:hypothetical protein
VESDQRQSTGQVVNVATRVEQFEHNEQVSAVTPTNQLTVGVTADNRHDLMVFDLVDDLLIRKVLRSNEIAQT